jgi:hypothetical protein
MRRANRAIETRRRDPSSWIKPTDKPQVIRTTGQKKEVTLLPLNSLFDRCYTVY